MKPSVVVCFKNNSCRLDGSPKPSSRFLVGVGRTAPDLWAAFVSRGSYFLPCMEIPTRVLIIQHKGRTILQLKITLRKANITFYMRKIRRAREEPN